MINKDILKDYLFVIKLEVREYECDMQGIVNNAVYLNYFEFSRQKFLKNLGITFIEYINNGINFVVKNISINYKKSLKSEDEFFVGLNLERFSNLKINFLQDIFINNDDKKNIYCEAKTIIVAIDNNGKIIKNKTIFDNICEYK